MISSRKRQSQSRRKVVSYDLEVRDAIEAFMGARYRPRKWKDLEEFWQAAGDFAEIASQHLNKRRQMLLRSSLIFMDFQSLLSRLHEKLKNGEYNTLREMINLNAFKQLRRCGNHYIKVFDENDTNAE